MSAVSPPVTGIELPRIGWHGSEPLDHAKFEPVTRTPGGVLAGFTKPCPGGLWCTPLTQIDDLVCSPWVTGPGGTRHTGPLWEVIPHPDTSVFVIAGPADLDEAITRWPDPRNADPGQLDAHGYPAGGGVDLIDWPAMAQQYDAVYLTTHGVAALNNMSLPHYIQSITRRPARRSNARHLWGWDVPTVLFLQPTFTVGRSFPTTDEDIQRFKDRVEAHNEALAVEIRDAVIAELREQGVQLSEFILNLPPQGFVMIYAQIAREQQGAA